MKKTKFNQSWKVSKIDGKILGQQINGFPEGKSINLPHDAMIEESTDINSRNNTQTAYFPGGYYRYTKDFTAPEEWKDKIINLEFEGSYMNSRVYLNNNYVGCCHYGYSNFYVNLDKHLLYGKKNRVEVLVNNEELNSRWYTGTGLYRNVWLYEDEQIHFAIDGIKISTPDVEKDMALVLVQSTVKSEDKLNHKITIKTEILDRDGFVVTEESGCSTIYGQTEQSHYQRIGIVNPQLWDSDNPYLYTCRLTLESDRKFIEQAEVKFGVRKLQMDSIHGLRINGKQVKLRGACIHHDNGIIGACTLEMAEERRCCLLKEAGFNCIRSSHHPLSKAMLDACDKYGMLVMDEFSDMWTWSKNMNDYATYFDMDWENDVEKMVVKDYNHPSVILYSTGNEIQEVGTPKGVEINRMIAGKIRSIDSTRYVTCGFNGWLAGIDYEQTISKDIKEKAVRENKNLNDMMGEMMDIGDEKMIASMEVHPIMTERIDAFMGCLDVAGYNYLTLRHEMDRERKSHRVVLGSETFPCDIPELWEIVKRNNHVIGDMTWTGYDYLGEAGLGTIKFEGEKEIIGRTSWSGDIDITGKRRPVSYFREIVYGIRKAPYIAVEDPAHFGIKQQKSKWAFEDSIPSWTWKGYEGKTIIVDVYSASDEVELFINGKSQGKKQTGEKKRFTAKYEVTYEPGTILVKAYYIGNKSQEFILTDEIHTAEEKVNLEISSNITELRPNGSDIAFITVELCDKNGIVNMQAKKDIRIEAQGVGVVQGYGNADPYFQGTYQQKTIPTFEGRVQAAIRASYEEGEAIVRFMTEGCASVEMKIPVKKC